LKFVATPALTGPTGTRLLFAEKQVQDKPTRQHSPATDNV